jgi:scyllo-inositol 2-dehydrogenase (NADP+)
MVPTAYHVSSSFALGQRLSSQHTNNGVIDVGLIGFGFAGRVFHAPMISAVAGLRLAAIVLHSAEKQRPAGEDPRTLYPAAQVLGSPDELLQHSNIRLVVIATPNTTHAELTRKCLVAGRDVVVDKPFAVTSREAAELANFAKNSNRLLAVYHNRRWDSDFRTIQQLLGTNDLGRIVSYEAHYDRFRPQLRAGWREVAQPGSGILFDLGSHLIDQALVLFGPPEFVMADVRTERESSLIDDAFDVELHYPHMRVWLRASMLAADHDVRYVLRGTRATYTKRGLDPQEQALLNGAHPTVANCAAWGKEPPEIWGTLISEENGKSITKAVESMPGDYRVFYEQMRDAILGLRPVPVDAEEACNVVRCVELAHESSRQRCALPWTKEHSKPT